MSSQFVPDSSLPACITVSFNPDLAILRRQLLALPAKSLKLVIDNASAEALQPGLAELCAHIEGVHLLNNPVNLGLAAALNLGVAVLHDYLPRPRLLLLLDQDSEPATGSVQKLLESFTTLQSQGRRPGAVGPLMLDADTGLSHGFHQATRWRWRRVYPPAGSAEAVACTNLNGSGTLMSVDLYERLGGLDEAFFIDHIDTDWSFRILAAGYSLWGIPGAVFSHRMGESSRRFWFLGWRVWPSRSPKRHYFLFRNALLLMRRPYVWSVWKFWVVVKLLVTFIVHGLVGDDAKEQRINIYFGVRDALRSKAENRPLE